MNEKMLKFLSLVAVLVFIATLCIAEEAYKRQAEIRKIEAIEKCVAKHESYVPCFEIFNGKRPMYR